MNRVWGIGRMRVTGESRRKGWQKYLNKCNFVHHKSDTDWHGIKSGPSRCRADDEASISCNYLVTCSSSFTENTARAHKHTRAHARTHTLRAQNVAFMTDKHKVMSSFDIKTEV